MRSEGFALQINVAPVSETYFQTVYGSSLATTSFVAP